MFLSSMDWAGGALLHGRRRREGFRGRAAPSSRLSSDPGFFLGQLSAIHPASRSSSPAPAPSLPTPRFKIPLGLLPSHPPHTYVISRPRISQVSPSCPPTPRQHAQNAPPIAHTRRRLLPCLPPPRTHHTEPPSPDRPPGQRLPADHAPHSHTPRGAITARERRHVRGNPINRQRGEPVQGRDPYPAHATVAGSPRPPPPAARPPFRDKRLKYRGRLTRNVARRYALPRRR